VICYTHIVCLLILILVVSSEYLKQLLDGIHEIEDTGIFKEEALDRALYRTRLARCYGPVVGQSAKRTNVMLNTKDRKCQSVAATRIFIL
jgi:hypothetical protein